MPESGNAVWRHRLKGRPQALERAGHLRRCAPYGACVEHCCIAESQRCCRQQRCRSVAAAARSAYAYSHARAELRSDKGLSDRRHRPGLSLRRRCQAAEKGTVDATRVPGVGRVHHGPQSPAGGIQANYRSECSRAAGTASGAVATGSPNSLRRRIMVRSASQGSVSRGCSRRRRNRRGTK